VDGSLHKATALTILWLPKAKFASFVTKVGLPVIVDFDSKKVLDCYISTVGLGE